MLSTKDHQKTLQSLKIIVIDEWHELWEQKGVQIELAIAYLNYFLPNLKVWGISATIGNKDLASKILLDLQNLCNVNAEIKKNRG